MLTRIVGSLIQNTGAKNDMEFWSRYSSLSSGTAMDHMVATLTKAGYSGSPREMLNSWIASCSGVGNSKFDGGAKIFNVPLFNGITFYKNYASLRNTVNADLSVGSSTGTWTVTRSASTPATYCDANGLIQVKTDQTPRFTAGFYNSTGFVSRPGLLMEGASTNLFINSDTDTDWTYNSGTDAWQTSAATARFAMVYANSGSATETVDTSTFVRRASLSVAITNDGTSANTDVIFRSASGTNPYTLVGSSVYTLSFSVWCDQSLTIPVKVVKTADGADNGLDSTFQTVANSWVKISKTFTATSSATSRMEALLGAQGNFTIKFECFQIENLPFASSWIPPVGATTATTRNAETLTYPISGNRTAATESVFFKYTPFAASTAITANQCLMDSDTKRRFLLITASTDKLEFAANVDDSTLARGALTSNLSAFQSYVFAGIANGPTGNPNTLIYLDGVNEGTDNDDYTSPAWGTNFQIGINRIGTEQSFGIISSLAIFSDAKDATSVGAIGSVL